MNDTTASRTAFSPEPPASQFTAAKEPPATSGCYRFESFEIDIARRELRRNGLKIHLKGRPFTLLKVLVESHGRIVTREELRGHLWSSDTHVDFDANLTTAFYKVRKALGDSSRESKFIETIPGQGYRFIEPVFAIAREAEKPSLPAATPVAAIENEAAAPAARFLLPRHRVLSLALAGAVLLAIVFAGYIRAQSSGGAQPSGVRLLVLPFANPSDYTADEQFCDGLNDELVTQLTRHYGAQLSVIAETTALSYRHANKSVQDMAQELNVAYVVEGAVQRDDGHIHISARLVRAADQSEIWADSFDRPNTDALKLESEVAGHIADGLSAKVASAGNQRFSLSRAFGGFLGRVR